MAVVAVGGGAGVWGTWEELVLGGAVLRHGGAAWSAVANELRSRSPCAFSPEECEAKFAEIQSRYSTCNAWFEELRKQRVAELKRELEKSESSIGSLQSVIESLNNSKHGDGSSECRTSPESCSQSENIADTNSSSKELSRDRSSAASFTEEASNCQKSQQVQQCDTDSIQANNIATEQPFLKPIDEKVCAKDSLLWGSRKQRGARVKRILPKSDDSLDREGCSEGCSKKDLKTPNGESGVKKDLKAPNVESGVMKDLKAPNVGPGVMKKCLKTSNAESDSTKKGLTTPNVEPGPLKKGLKTPNAESAEMKKGLKTPKVESSVTKNNLKTPKVECVVMKNLLKTPKVESGVMKNGLKTPKVESTVTKSGLKTSKVDCDMPVADREKPNLVEILKTISAQGDCLMLQRQVDAQRKRARYKKMIRQHMDFRILHSKIKTGAISSTKELLRDMLLFVNNVIAFYPKATLEHMAAIELRDLACKTVKQSASFVPKSLVATGTASAPVAKKNARALQPGRHAPGDAMGNKVSSRDATAKQGAGKDVRSDASLPDNGKTVRGNEPVKKRGVGRPPKSTGPLKRSAAAQEDSPSKGRKRLRR